MPPTRRGPAGSRPIPPRLIGVPAGGVQRLQTLFDIVPTVVDLYLDRPAIIPEVAAGAAALLVNYGSSARADVVFGQALPQGRLPFDLSSCTRAVEESRSDLPFDTADPLFRFGDGLRYRGCPDLKMRRLGSSSWDLATTGCDQEMASERSRLASCTPLIGVSTQQNVNGLEAAQR